MKTAVSQDRHYFGKDLESAPSCFELSTAVVGKDHTLHAVLDGGDLLPSRKRAVGAALISNAVLVETTNMSALHIVGQIRLLAVDLLRASGVERTRAQELVRGAPAA